jgi:hypothetical protein
MLVNVNTWDWPTFACAAMFLALVALTASWLPADRAARINPTIALRTPQRRVRRAALLDPKYVQEDI